MYIKLFDVENGVAKPTAQCYVINWLKDIMEKYPDNYLKIFSYLQFMYSWNPEDNPYLAMKEEDREETIIADIKPDFSLELPAYRTWLSCKKALDNIRDYLLNTKIVSGKDGNNKDYRDTMKDLPNLQKAYNEGYKEFMEEAKLEVRGGRYNSLT